MASSGNVWERSKQTQRPLPALAAQPPSPAYIGIHSQHVSLEQLFFHSTPLGEDEVLACRTARAASRLWQRMSGGQHRAAWAMHSGTCATHAVASGCCIPPSTADSRLASRPAAAAAASAWAAAAPPAASLPAADAAAACRRWRRCAARRCATRCDDAFVEAPRLEAQLQASMGSAAGGWRKVQSRALQRLAKVQAAPASRAVERNRGEISAQRRAAGAAAAALHRRGRSGARF